jgi:hypothetical protein
MASGRPKMPRVTFGRINRRAGEQVALELRPFHEDLKRLADSGETRAAYKGREWVAADLVIDSTNSFLSGVLGFMDSEKFTIFEEEAFSWLKGETREAVGATPNTMVPFAIDLRDDRRWIGFVTSRHIRARRFQDSLTAILNETVASIGLMPSEWAVDLVISAETVYEWIEEHPEVARLTRIVKFPNPSQDYDDERQRMRQLGAARKEEVYTPRRGERLRLDGNPEMDAYLEGVDLGFVEIRLQSREGADSKAFFTTAEQADRITIDPYGEDLAIGMQRVQDVVRRFSASRAGEPDPQGSLDVE